MYAQNDRNRKTKKSVCALQTRISTHKLRIEQSLKTGKESLFFEKSKIEKIHDVLAENMDFQSDSVSKIFDLATNWAPLYVNIGLIWI